MRLRNWTSNSDCDANALKQATQTYEELSEWYDDGLSTSSR